MRDLVAVPIDQAGVDPDLWSLRAICGREILQKTHLAPLERGQARLKCLTPGAVLDRPDHAGQLAFDLV
ncbi:hypothetical protein [Neoroseomonas rubea]|uniref:hypothetical protein n=1 Tax=Neoroseomonas rubea TaxID=2748666 RepID=UPI001E4527F3|nr:hypothetical protein [Roseomonas rubea]